MIRRYLENYKEFECIAAECPDTCCSGWLIEIDEDSLRRFEKLSAGDADFKSRVNFAEGCFFQSDNKDCAFLLQNGLCKMQKEYGEDMLCYTCDMYPRHVEEFPNVREYSLSASCPVVAKEMVSKSKYISFTEEMDREPDPDSIDEYEDYNDLLYEKLLEIRDRLISLLKSNGTFDEKAEKILEAMSLIQEDLDIGIYDGVEDAFVEVVLNDQFLSEDASGFSIIDTYLGDLHTMRTLETLREDFVSWMQEAEDKLVNLCRDDCDIFENKLGQFKKEYSNIDLIQCNVALYLIFTYFCGAVYDDYVYSVARLAVFAARVVKILSFAKWLEDGKVDIDIILYKFCRELEHSNENLNMILQKLDLV